MNPDLILFNANVLTMDPSFPSADLVVIHGGRILKVTRNEIIKKNKNKRTVVIDCQKKTVLPGFNDAHFHLHAFAESLLTLNLSSSKGIRSISDIQTEIKKISQKIPHGTWIRAAGYDEFHLFEKRHPNRWDLDRAAPHHPLKLTHRSGHAHVLNSLALKLTGISQYTPDPPGGLIERDLESGEPTGVLYGMGDFLSKRIPPLDRQQIDEGITLANQELSSLGITSIQDTSARNDISRWNMFQQWQEKGLLKLRVNMMMGWECFRERPEYNFLCQFNQEQLHFGGVKIILDEVTGQLNPSQNELNEMVWHIHQSGFQVALHAVEETTIEASCNALENALRKVPRSNHRHRIEHCSVCPPALAKRLASLGIMVVTQPSFIYYHGDRYLETVPNRQLKHLYPIGTLIKNGAQVAAGSDCPIAPPNPWVGIFAAASRTTDTGRIVLPEEQITPMETIRMYTDYAAKAGFEEGVKGSITAGKMADLVVLNDDPTQVPIREIKEIEVEMTILNGEIVWDKNG
jgi:predicted amidohydrolase YtcJ